MKTGYLSLDIPCHTVQGTSILNYFTTLYLVYRTFGVVFLYLFQCLLVFGYSKAWDNYVFAYM